MRITIDNQDGLGAIDYTRAVAAEGPITIQRALNKPSRCTAEFVLGIGDEAVPARRGRVIVTNDAGATLFTGYLATEPVRTYIGEASEGAVYRARITAVSDEWLLDNLGSGAGQFDADLLGLGGATLVSRLVARLPSGAPLAITGSGTQSTGSFTPTRTAPFSTNAGAAASAGFASYRALNGTVQVQTAGSTTHTLTDADGSLTIAELATANVRELANDITLSGAEEPAAYVTECFLGDGTTNVFPLSEAAFRETAARRTLLRDSFNEPALDTTTWAVNDPGSHLSLTSAGLTLNGGNGFDGQTTLTAIDAVEMGGSLVAQVSGVMFGAASAGMLAGFYQGATTLANCFAGFRVRQSTSGTGSQTVLVPVLNGAEVGTVFTPVAGHTYTLRLRLHCVETQRVMQRYYAMVDGVVESFGSAAGVSAPMDVVFELVDEGVSSNTPATVLYDSATVGGAVSSTPAQCAFVAVNAIQLFGSIAAVSVTRPGTLWVTSTLSSGTQQTRLIGIAGQGVDCTASYGSTDGTPGKLTFFAGRIPVAGERVTVSYRTQSRSVARLMDTASVATEGTSRWFGKVLAPAARSSADCESAAQAVLALATSRSAAVSGSYAMVNPATDVWPGDVLAITSAGVTTAVLVRSVSAKDLAAVPEVLTYELRFANDWATEYADGLGIKLSEEIAADAWLPQAALDSAAPPGTNVLPNLQQLTITSLTQTTLGIDTGTAPPPGGGIEVRRTDWQFGPTTDAADLVLRSPVRSFTLPRAAQVERFYLRLYDASIPPKYSRFSSAVFVNAPVN